VVPIGRRGGGLGGGRPWRVPTAKARKVRGMASGTWDPRQGRTALRMDNDDLDRLQQQVTEIKETFKRQVSPSSDNPSKYELL